MKKELVKMKAEIVKLQSQNKADEYNQELVL